MIIDLQEKPSKTAPQLSEEQIKKLSGTIDQLVEEAKKGQQPKPKERPFGSLKGMLLYMALDFNG